MSAKCLDDVREVSRTSSCGLSGVRTIPSTRDYPGTGDPADHPLETGLLPCKTGFFTSWRTLMRLALARDVGIGKCVTPRSLEVAAERHPVPAPRLRVAAHAERAGKFLREDTCRCPYSVSWRDAPRCRYAPRDILSCSSGPNASESDSGRSATGTRRIWRLRAGREAAGRRSRRWGTESVPAAAWPKARAGLRAAPVAAGCPATSMSTLMSCPWRRAPAAAAPSAPSRSRCSLSRRAGRRGRPRRRSLWRPPPQAFTHARAQRTVYGKVTNRSLKAVAFAASPSIGITPKISSIVRSVELWV